MATTAGAGAGAGAGAAVAKAKAGGAMKFWFTGGGELSEPQLATEVGSLNAFSAAQLNGFVDTVIAFLLNPSVRWRRSALRAMGWWWCCRARRV